MVARKVMHLCNRRLFRQWYNIAVSVAATMVPCRQENNSYYSQVEFLKSLHTHLQYSTPHNLMLPKLPSLDVCLTIILVCVFFLLDLRFIPHSALLLACIYTVSEMLSACTMQCTEPINRKFM